MTGDEADSAAYLGKQGHSPEHAQALRIRKDEWVPLNKLPSFSVLQQQPRLPLMSVLNFLSFDALSPPPDMSQLMCVAYRERAFRALCAAAREDKVRLVGAPQGTGLRQRIEPVEFDISLSLADEDGAIGIDLEAVTEAVTMERYMELRQMWRDVYVERSSLVDWLNKMFAKTRRIATADRIKRCQEWLVKLRENGPQRLQKAQYKDEARETFGVGPDQFRTAWKTAAARVPNTDWGVPGAPKKK
jgi:hypothetical protein